MPQFNFIEFKKDYITINYKKTQYKIWQPLVIDMNIKCKRNYKPKSIIIIYIAVLAVVLLSYYKNYIPGYICLLYVIPLLINFIFYKEYKHTLVITFINTKEYLKINEEHVLYFQEKIAEFKIKTNT